MSEVATVRGGAVRWGIAIALASSPTAYAVLRAIESRASPEPDPASIVWAERSAQLTRLTLAAYVAAGLATGAIALARQWPDARARVFEVCACASVAAITLQSLVLP